MPAQVLPKGSIIKFATVAAPATKLDLTEENRSELSVEVERIGDSGRMVNGRMRKWFVADKRTWSVSWDLVPHSSAFTVDGKMGGQDIRNFYDSTPGEFYLYVRGPNGADEQVLVTFASFSSGVNKRGLYEFWTISLSVEEV